MSKSPAFKVQSLALCLPLTLLLACGQNDSKKKNDAPVVQKDAPAEPAPAPAPSEPTAVEPVPEVSAPLPAPVEPAVTPAPVEPAPVTPAPVEPAPVTPAPVEPAPAKPAPVEPAPSKPAPGKPVQQPESTGNSAGCEIYDSTQLSSTDSGSVYFVATSGADGTYKSKQAFFIDAECKVPVDGAEEQELQD